MACSTSSKGILPIPVARNLGFMSILSNAKVGSRFEAYGRVTYALNGGKKYLLFHNFKFCHPMEWLLYFNKSTGPRSWYQRRKRHYISILREFVVRFNIKG
jgi:hypothetical protein